MTRPTRTPHAVAVVLVTVPAVTVAHLAVTGTAPGPAALLLVAAVVASCVLLVPVRSLAALTALVAVAQAAAHAVLSLTGTPATAPGCLSVVGRGAALGVRFALLREDEACPGGTLAVTPAATVVLSAVLAALAVLLGHAVVAVLTAALVTAAQAALVTCRHLAGSVAGFARRVLAVLAPVVAPVPVRPARITAAREVPLHFPGADWVPAVSVRRGPPRPVCGLPG